MKNTRPSKKRKSADSKTSCSITRPPRTPSIDPPGTPHPAPTSNNDPEQPLESENENVTTDMDMESGSEGSGGQQPKIATRKPLAKRARCWQHFTVIEGNEGRAQCNYCEATYAVESGKNGTSNMNAHMKKCPNHPDNKEKNSDNHTIARFCQSGGGVLSDGGSNLKFDQLTVRKAVVRMIIVDELPFKFVENEGFRDLMFAACPQFVMPSRTTVARDCLKRYYEEKNKLKTLFRAGQIVSLTTDTWTSNQRLSYLSLTGHYIDDEWKLHKLILNFIPCPDHKGEEVGQLIEKCLLEWGIEKVFAITVDNASANDVTVRYLRDRFVSWGTAILDGKYLHMRCVAHIINLIVRAGLTIANASIDRVRAVVRYIRSSPMRLKRFNDIVVEEKIESKRSLCLDVATRWNSTYLMLDTALIYQGVFDTYIARDGDIRRDFLHGGVHDKIGLPSKYDWNVVKKFVHVLRYFYEITLRVSGTLYVTSNNFLDEIFCMREYLVGLINGVDSELVEMATKMKEKFDKYWGDIEKFNLMLYVGFMLDPRHKVGVLHYYLKNMYGSTRAEEIVNCSKSALFELFDEYKKAATSQTTTASSSSSPSSGGSLLLEVENHHQTEANITRKMRIQELISGVGLEQSEVDMFLNERMEKACNGFDVLGWWKLHSPRFPVLSKLARDILAMPITSVASESTFSTGGRVIDDFRASLTPKSAQALICCQDWLRRNPLTSAEESLEFIEKIEQDMIAGKIIVDTNIVGV